DQPGKPEPRPARGFLRHVARARAPDRNVCRPERCRSDGRRDRRGRLGLCRRWALETADQTGGRSRGAALPGLFTAPAGARRSEKCPRRTRDHRPGQGDLDETAGNRRTCRLCTAARTGDANQPPDRRNRRGDRDERRAFGRYGVSAERFRIGFLPLVDAALPILAHELGFAAREGVEIEFIRDMTWATVRDRLLYGHTDAAHLIAPLAIATALGRDRPAVPLAVPFVLGLNGNAVTFSTALAAEVGLGDGLGDPAALGAALREAAAARKAAGRPLRFGVVHRYSSHNYMLRYWLAGVGIQPDSDVEITVTSPPFAADALAAGEVDGICVGEPWNAIAVD